MEKKINKHPKERPKRPPKICMNIILRFIRQKRLVVAQVSRTKVRNFVVLYRVPFYSTFEPFRGNILVLIQFG